MFFLKNAVWLARFAQQPTTTKQTEEKKKQNTTENWGGRRRMEKKVFEKKGKFLQVNRAQSSFRAMLCYL